MTVPYVIIAGEGVSEINNDRVKYIVETIGYAK